MLVILNLDSPSFHPFEINKELFEDCKKFFHVFSFDFECVSIGKFSEVINFGYPYFRRISGGGLVFHGPHRDISMAFSFFSRSINIREVFSQIYLKLLNFIRLNLGFKCSIRDDGIYSNGDKIFGMAAARKKNFFLIEGCILAGSNDVKRNIIKKEFMCFQNFGVEIKNFYDISYNLLKFLKENFAEI